MALKPIDTGKEIGYIYQEKMKPVMAREGKKMKSTGIVRKVDELGRIVLPIELRRVMNIQIKDSLEIMTEDDKIILKKYEPCCVFCYAKEDVQEFKGRCVCRKCIQELVAQ